MSAGDWIAIGTALLSIVGSVIGGTWLFSRQKRFEAQMAAESAQLVGLNQKRAEIIADLYAKFVQAYQAAEYTMQRFDPGGMPSRQKRYEEFTHKFNEASIAFRDNRVFLSESLAEMVKSALDEIRTPVQEFAFFFFEEMNTSKWCELVERLEGETRVRVRAVENEFRKVLGVCRNGDLQGTEK